MEIKKFCELYQLDMNLKKRWYEYVFRFFYTKRQNKYVQGLTYVCEKYSELEEKIQEIAKYYDEHEVPKIAPYTAERMSFDMPTFDFTESDVVQKILKTLDFYTKESNGIWKLMFQRTEEIIRSARRRFMIQALTYIPSGKKIVEIEGEDGIFRCYPREKTKKELQEIIETWEGNPLKAKVEYW